VEIVPSVADHVTAVFGVFVTSAVNETVPADGTVAVVGVTVTMIAGEMITWKVCDPPTLLESVTLTPKLEVPAVEGAPETVPLLALMTSPAGSCPDEIVKV
jgi:hypothetical protein